MFSCFILNFYKSIVVFFNFEGSFFIDCKFAVDTHGINEILLKFYTVTDSDDFCICFSASLDFNLLNVSFCKNSFEGFRMKGLSGDMQGSVFTFLWDIALIPKLLSKNFIDIKTYLKLLD